MEFAVGDGLESGAACHRKGAAVLKSSRTGKMFHGMSHNFLNTVFCIYDFALQFRFRKIGEIGMRHRMAADLKALRAELARLFGIEVAGHSQKSSRQIESCVEAKFTKDGSGRDQVRLAAIVEGDADARLRWVTKRFADAQAAKAGLFDPLHLDTECFERQN